MFRRSVSVIESGDLRSFEDMTSINSGGIADANILRQHFEALSLTPGSSPRSVEHGESIIIVGAGAFGSSLALELVTHYRHKYPPEEPVLM